MGQINLEYLKEETSDLKYFGTIKILVFFTYLSNIKIKKYTKKKIKFKKQKKKRFFTCPKL